MSRVQKKPLIFPWINNSKLIIRRGDIGLSGNFYVGIVDFSQISFLIHYAYKDMVFIDIGANLGEYSIAASNVKGCHSVIFEPAIETVSRLTKVLDLNEMRELSTMYQYAVGEFNQKILFTQSLDSLNHIIKDESDGVEVKMVSLDSFDFTSKNLFLKIDVEGDEYSVLKGAKKLFENNQIEALIIENNDINTHFFLIEKGFTPIYYDPLLREISILSTPSILSHDSIYVKHNDINLIRIKMRNSEKFRCHQSQPIDI